PLLLVVSDEKRRLIHSLSLGHFDEQRRAYNLRLESRRREDFYAGRPDFEALIAPEAVLQPRRSNADDERGWQWLPLQPGRRLRYTAYGYTEEPWLEPAATLITPAMLERQVLGEGVMTWTELKRLAENDLEVRLEMERRRSEPWACAAVVLAGLTAVLFLARRSSEPSYVHNAVVAVLICVIFYVLRLSFLSLGEREALSAVTAAWLPILFTAAAAGWGFCRLEK
ncbi:MAG: LptF/LptG family permease, partial [Planctomycetota bacterium]|nr:LptF/LptG family permease [Planctomycetota bacterium]